jgi:hypothetical protein
MKSRLLWIILSAIVVLMLGVAAAACGDDDDDGNGAPTGDGEPDAAAYFTDVDRIQNRLTVHLADIEEQSQEAYGDAEKAATSLAAATSAGEAALADINALDVPSVAATAHADLVAAADALISALDGMIAGLEGIEGNGPDYQDWLGDVAQTDSAYTLAVEQLREACDGMQDAVDNSPVKDIVIQCPI